MSQLLYGPPAKFQALKDFVPCVASYSANVCTFRYATKELMEEAYVGLTLLGIPTHLDRMVVKGNTPINDRTLYISTSLLKDSDD